MARKKKKKKNFRNLQGEIWKLVPGTEDYYVSNKNRFRRGDKLLKVTPDQEGYYRCNIGKLKKRFHRLVAEAFIPNPDNLPVVDHIDNDRSNNTPENLRWVTQQQNAQAAKDMGLGIDMENAYIFAIDSNKKGYLFNTQAEASDVLGISKRQISLAVLNKTNHKHRDWFFFKVKEFVNYIDSSKFKK